MLASCTGFALYRIRATITHLRMLATALLLTAFNADSPPLTAKSVGVASGLRGAVDAADVGDGQEARWVVATEDGLVLLSADRSPVPIAGALDQFDRPVAVDRVGVGACAAIDADGDVVLIERVDDTPVWTTVLELPQRASVSSGAVESKDGRITRVAFGFRHAVAVLQVDGQSGWRTSVDAEIARPGGMAFGGDGALIVTDADRSTITAFDAAGHIVATRGSRGSFPGQFKDPRGVAVVGGVVLVADRLNHRIVRLKPDLSFLDFWGMHAVWPRAADGATHYPAGIAVSASGNEAIVLEPFERRAQLFAAVTEEERAKLSGLVMPSVDGVQSHFGPSIDSANGRLVVFDPEGGAVVLFLHTLPQPIHVSTVGMPGTTMSPAKRAEVNAIVGESIEGPGRLGRVASLALSRDGSELLIADDAHGTLQLWHLAPTPEPLKFDPFLPELSRVALQSSLLPPGGSGVADIAATADGWAVLSAQSSGADEAIVTLLDRRLTPVSTIALPTAGAEASRVEWCGGRVAVLVPAARAIVLATDSGPKVVSIEGARAPTDVVFRDADPTDASSPIGAGFIVTDAQLDGVLLTDEEGRTERFIGGTGLSDARFWSPDAITVDPDGTVIVVDGGNHRLQRFQPNKEGALEWTMTFSLGRAYTRPRNLDAPAESTE